MMKIEKRSMSRQLKKSKKNIKKATKKKTKKTTKANITATNKKKKVAAKKVSKKPTTKKQASKKQTHKKQVTKKPASKKSASKKVVQKKINKKVKENKILAPIEEVKSEITLLDIQPEESKTDNKNLSDTDIEILELEKKKKTYWSDETEKAVVDFLNYDCNYYQVKLEKYIEECTKNKKSIDMSYIEHLQEKFEWASHPDIIAKKEKIYKDYIHKPLNRLVENIIFNFKLFRPGVDVKTLQSDCLSFVYGKFSNFNPDQNTKSFSFFGTIAKHYLMGEKKETDKSQQVNLDYDVHKEEADSTEVVEMDEKSDLDTSFQLFSFVTDSLESKIQEKLNNPDDRKNMSENDLKVADAIVQIFKNHELLGAYNKNHVYYLIKEYTGLQTKDITYSLGRFRVFYRLLKQDFIKQNADKD